MPHVSAKVEPSVSDSRTLVPDYGDHVMLTEMSQDNCANARKGSRDGGESTNSREEFHNLLLSMYKSEVITAV